MSQAKPTLHPLSAGPDIHEQLVGLYTKANNCLLVGGSLFPTGDSAVISEPRKQVQLEERRSEPGFPESLSKLGLVVIIWRKLLFFQASFSITSRPESGKTACLFTAVIMLKGRLE